MPDFEVTIRDVYAARQKIAGLARRTPLLRSRGLRACLKAENLQETGSFKIRGAANRLLNLTPEEKERGVITVSSGNHGRAVSYVAGRLGVKAVICLSEAVPRNKVEAIRMLGAEVVVHGKSYDDATEHAVSLQKERGLTMVHPFDDPFVVAGQGTIALEIVEDMPGVDAVIVPVSGGGLMGGIALTLRAVLGKTVRVVGATMERAPVMYHSLLAGKPVEIEEEPTIADALAGGIGLYNRYTFRLCREYVDDMVLVSEEEIEEAIAFALREHNLVVEGGGAVGIAAMMGRKISGIGENSVVVVSGGNIDASLLLDVANRHLATAIRQQGA